MAVKVIIRRWVQKDNLEKLNEHLLELRSLATVQPGYISGETLRNIEDPEEFLVISTWQSADQWKKWFSSRKRTEIGEKIKPLIKKETEYGIYVFD